MYAVGKLSQYITQGVYTVSGPFHPFGGAVDIIVVQQPDGSFKTSPWYVKFGKFQGVLKAREKVVNICVNGDKVPFHMYLDHKGEAHFLREVDSQEEESIFYLSSSGDDSDEKLHRARPEKSPNQDVKKEQVSVEQSSTVKSTTPTRSNSRRNRFLGLVFGRRPTEEDARLVNGERFVERISSLERAEIAADLLDVKWSTNIKTAEVISRREDASSILSKQSSEKIHESLVERPNSELLDVTTDVATSTDDLDSKATRNFDESVDLTDRLKHIVSNGEDFNALMSTQDVYTAECYNLADAVDNVTEHRIFNEVVDDTKITSDECKPSSEASCPMGAKCLIPDDSDLVLKVPAQRSFCLAEGVDIVSGKSIQGDADHDIEKDEAVQTPGVDASCATFSEKAGDVVLVISDSSNHLEERANCSGEVEKSAMADMSNKVTPTLSASVLSAENCSDAFCFEEDINSEHIKDLTMVQQSATIEGCIGRNSEEKSDTGVLDKTTQFGLENFSIELLSSDDNKVVSLEAASTENASPVDLVLYAVEVQPKAVSNIGHDSDLTSQSASKVNAHETKEHEFQIMSLPFRESQPEVLAEKIAITAADDQLLFEYVDNALLDSTQVEESRELDQDPLLCADDQFRGSIKSCVLSSYTEESSQESTARESLFQDPVVPSSPIPIMQNHAHEKDVEELVKSSQGILDDDVFADNQSSDNQYLSRSLDSTSDVLKQAASEENYFESFSSKSAPEDSSMNIQISREGNSDDVKDAFEMPMQDYLRSHLHVAELSLCRHLLSEGMGAEAAALAFDSEKMNLEKFRTLGPSIVNNDKLVVRINGCYFPWESAGPIILGMASFGQDYVFKPEGEILVEKVKNPSMEVIVSSNGNWGIWPFSFRRSKTIAVSSPQNPDSIVYADNTIFDSSENVKRCKKKLKKKVRAIVPTSEQLASLNLKDGRNIITFTFSTAMLGEQQVDANIYLWKWNSKIVVSDVDGTITKSDVLGQFMPLVGKDWSQTGVAHLFSAIRKNGYELLFLSARAISQAHLTRQFLFNLKQDGKALPDGPVVISPDGLFPSLFREVIRRAPHEFKIACLEDIRALFPSHCNPFYAGFGNRNTDELSYLKVGIPKGKIFTINPKGEVAVHQRVHKKTYTSLHALVDDMFPATRLSEQEEYNSWNYWRISIPDIDI